MTQRKDAPGDAPAPEVAELVDRYYIAVFGYLYWLLDDRIAARDITHSTFLHVYHLRTQLAHIPDPQPWLFQGATELARKGRAAACQARRSLVLPEHCRRTGTW